MNKKNDTHISPSQVSYGPSIVSTSVKIDNQFIFPQLTDRLHFRLGRFIHHDWVENWVDAFIVSSHSFLSTSFSVLCLDPQWVGDKYHSDGSMCKRGNPSADALELHLFCIKPSIWYIMFDQNNLALEGLLQTCIYYCFIIIIIVIIITSIIIVKNTSKIRPGFWQTYMLSHWFKISMFLFIVFFTFSENISCGPAIYDREREPYNKWWKPCT